MALTLLQLVDQSCGEMGLTQPTAVMSSTNHQTAQLRALIQRLGKDLVREFEWNRLIRILQFYTAVAVTKTGDTTAGSNVVTGMSDTNNISAIDHDVVSGAGISANTEIASIDSPTQITMTRAATAAATGVTLTFAQQDYLNPLPAGDFDRFVSQSFYEQTTYRPISGSKSSQEWQFFKNGLVQSGINYRFRILNGKLRIDPAPTAVIALAFEYVSTYWVIAAADLGLGAVSSKAAFTLDTDICIFPDDLMLAGLKYYFRRAKGLDFWADSDDFSRILAVRKAQDVPLEPVSLTPSPVDPLAVSIPEGNWDL